MKQKTIKHKGSEILVFGWKADGKTFGVSRYKNITIVWDEDYDTRVCDFVDEYLLGADAQYKNLIAVSEREGMLSLLFFGYIPDEFKTDGIEVCNDWWIIHSTKAVSVKDVL